MATSGPQRVKLLSRRSTPTNTTSSNSSNSSNTSNVCPGAPLRPLTMKGHLLTINSRRPPYNENTCHYNERSYLYN